ncbi:MAG: GNAT family N-acetyltransferase [Nitrososphaerales archaeon]
MTPPVIEIFEVPKGDREVLVPILEESFEGIYLWHAKRTLQSIEVVRVARTPEGADAGLAMLKVLPEGAGYVYYIAVPPHFRRQGIGGRLLDDALSKFAVRGVNDVYASVGEDNAESNALFTSRGFTKVEGSEMAGRYGRIRAFVMYREMMVVRGETLLGRRLQAAKAT